MPEELPSVQISLSEVLPLKKQGRQESWPKVIEMVERGSELMEGMRERPEAVGLEVEMVSTWLETS